MIDIDEIQPNGFMAESNLTGARLSGVIIDPPQHLRTTGLTDNDRF
jgi:hypothetical protein